MGSFKVNGGNQLKGDLVPQGAKNEALQILSAVLLTAETVTISNIPNIRDVMKLIDLLKDMGVEVEKLAADTYTFKAKQVNLDYLLSADFKAKGSSLRGSIMIIGPLLARYGLAYIPEPGGDKIGRRPVDTHLRGFENLGATFEHMPQDRFHKINGKNLCGTYMVLDEASVTGTANILMLQLWQKEQQVFIMQPVSPIFSSYAKC